MRALDESETSVVFEKLFKFTGNNLKNIVEKPSLEGPQQDGNNQGRYCFRLQKNKVFYVTDNAKHKVWLKPSSEMSFLYGNHVLKGGLGRITENTSTGDGVVVFSMSDVPLGFGVAAKSTQDCRKLDPNGIVVLHQADTGEYLRMEDDL
ncbi:hypothetical protein IFM89_002575 [Coptis chinensis]|uniref:PUA domain-containing protein n=1 Tax=Coptis chinensis TaxID=261450 RepID=A0A835HKS2_9MAGN|nr:hypothetical protein IFM89_002575 [Coptis chinensis]